MGITDSAASVGYTLTISVSTLIDAFLKRLTHNKSDERLKWWAHKIVDRVNIKITATGRENLPSDDEPLVIMSNHQSLMDIPIVYAVLPGRIRMVGKKELFAVPIWGDAMRASGFIRVDRQNHREAVRSLNQSAEQLRNGIRVWIAPEGTRSKTGKLGAFKSGGFRLAIDNQVRILPVAIQGTREILPPSSAVVHTNKAVRVTILPAIDPASYGLNGRKQLMETVRSAIASAL